MRLRDVVFCRWHNAALLFFDPPMAVCICHTPSGKIPLLAISALLFHRKLILNLYMRYCHEIIIIILYIQLTEI